MDKSKEKRCIICGQEKPGLHVKEDQVLGAIRWFKKNVTRNEQGYYLVVCKEDYQKYSKARRSYQRRQVFYLAVGVLFLAALLISSTDKLTGLLIGILVICFMYLLSLLTYMPGVEIPKGVEERLEKKFPGQKA